MTTTTPPSPGDRGWSVRFRRAPLQDVVADLTTAGSVIERLAGPRPAASTARTHPVLFDRLDAEP